jgi:GntR family transcriptional regulator
VALVCLPARRARREDVETLDPFAVLVQYSGVSNEERPVYLRLRDSIAALILDGKVRDGDPLPSVRSLAAEHGANPLTVAKAYQTFQDEGLILVRRGVGMFVAEGAAERLRAAERREFLDHRWPAIAEQIRRLGLDAEDLVERV